MSYLKEGISVVVPTYNYRDNLQRTLESLCQQTLPASRYQVIVADDGSTDDTEQLVASYQHRLNIQYVYQEDQGFRVSKARNLGAALAQFELLLFFDAGMVASPHLLEQHYLRHLYQPNLALIGMSYGVNEFTQEQPELMAELVNKFSLPELFLQLPRYPQLVDCRFDFFKSRQFSLSAQQNPWVIYWTGQVSCRTQVFRQLAGFDEWFNSWGGEDVEFGIRLFKQGCTFGLLPGHWSLHYTHHKDPTQRQQNAKSNIEYICQKHPDPAVAWLRQYSWQDIVGKITRPMAEFEPC